MKKWACVLSSIFLLTALGCRDLIGYDKFRWKVPDWGSTMIFDFRQLDSIEVESTQFQGRVTLVPVGECLGYPIERLYPVNIQELKESFGDFDFTSKLVPAYKSKDGMPGSKELLEEDIADIELISVADFDPAHPAGSSLNDIVYLEYLSYVEFINQRYEWNGISQGNGASPLKDDSYWLTEYRKYYGTVDPMQKGVYWTKITDQLPYGLNEDKLPYALSHVRLDEIANNPLHGVSVDRCPPSLTFPTLPSKPGVYPMQMTVTLKFRDYPERKMSVDFDLVVK